jgi:diaminopimelate epimerase
VAAEGQKFQQTPGDSAAGLPFAKMAGAGNDFVMIDHRDPLGGDPAGLAKLICTRRLSVGADGIILVEPSSRATFRMVYFNADGSLADFCANGTRCAARFAFLRGIAPREMSIETGAGIVDATILEETGVRLALPPPSGFEASRALRTGSGAVEGSFIVVGVPHYVIPVASRLWEIDIEPQGREIRMHPDLAPAGVNVNFVERRGSSAVDVRTWERGVEGETMACGSGVVASVAVLALLGELEPPVSVLTRSGAHLQVDYRIEGERLAGVTLEGDARIVYEGVLSGEAASGFDPEFVRDPAAAESRRRP